MLRQAREEAEARAAQMAQEQRQMAEQLERLERRAQDEVRDLREQIARQQEHQREVEAALEESKTALAAAGTAHRKHHVPMASEIISNLPMLGSSFKKKREKKKEKPPPPGPPTATANVGQGLAFTAGAHS